MQFTNVKDSLESADGSLYFLYLAISMCIICISVLIGEYAGTQGLGLLRLHSTYRHDLKIYASDEGRVQMTAAAFAKVCNKFKNFL